MEKTKDNLSGRTLEGLVIIWNRIILCIQGLDQLISHFRVWILNKSGVGDLGKVILLYPDSGISMDEEIVLGDMIWSYNKVEL